MRFLYPVPPNSIITQTFEDHVRRARANGWQNYNGGIDWALKSGTWIKAAQEGVVADIRNDATGYGNHVRILHPGSYLTIYGHMMDFAVKLGATVKAGDVIGRSDNTGNSTGPHLHFELRQRATGPSNGTPIDPEPLLVTSLTVEPPVIVDPQNPSENPFSTLSYPRSPIVWIDTTETLNIRERPTTASKIVGGLDPLTEILVLGHEIDGSGNVWVRIGYKQWIAAIYKGEHYARLK